MNILYLAHRVPFPPNKGDKLRSFRQVRHLAERHDVYCASFADSKEDRDHAAELAEFCKDVAAIPLHRMTSLARGMVGLIGGRTVTESYYPSSSMARTIRRWARRVDFDCAVAFSSGMAPHALRVSAGRRVLDLCDLDSSKWLEYAQDSRLPLQPLYRIEGRRLAQRESQWIDAFDATTLITQAEAHDLPRSVNLQKVHVVGNGVDLPKPAPELERSTVPTVGFVGVMNYKPNIDAVSWFVKKCWPSIRSEFPNAVFKIVGRRPDPSVRKLDAVPGVRVLGEVDDVQDQLQTFHISVAPLRIARGLQNKVLEAMASAVPVVLSSGAARGIEAVNNRDFLIADEPEDTAWAVVSLLREPSERRRIGWQGRQMVERSYRWGPILRDFELIVTGLTLPVQRPAQREIPGRTRASSNDINAKSAPLRNTEIG